MEITDLVFANDPWDHRRDSQDPQRDPVPRYCGRPGGFRSGSVPGQACCPAHGGAESADGERIAAEILGPDERIETGP